MLFKGVETPFKGLRSPFSTFRSVYRSYKPITRNFFSGGFGWWGVQPADYFWKTLREPPHSPPPKLPPGGIYPLLDGKELNGALENCVAERKKVFLSSKRVKRFC